jgi:PHD/YefM family antitoxin component YafN of YafNO toxin-antitoxin module
MNGAQLRGSSERQVEYPFFLRVVSEADAIQSLPTLLREADRQVIVVFDGDRELAVIVSAKEYESMRQARIDRFLQACDAMAEDAKKAGIVDEESLAAFLAE